jgi:hypothetical protein
MHLPGRRQRGFVEQHRTSSPNLHGRDNHAHLNDRVLEAGRPFAELQDAGMKTVKLEEIVRQKDPELKQVVEQLCAG